jgi:hypothetical protein
MLIGHTKIVRTGILGAKVAEPASYSNSVGEQSLRVVLFPNSPEFSGLWLLWGGPFRGVQRRAALQTTVETSIAMRLAVVGSMNSAAAATKNINHP